MKYVPQKFWPLFLIMLFASVFGCAHHTTTPTVPSSPPSGSNADNSSPSSSATSSSEPSQNQNVPVSSQTIRDAQNTGAYSDLVIKTLAIVKQAESIALSKTSSAEEVHSNTESAKALMGKAEDIYDRGSFSIPGFSDADTLMRDGMYQDRLAFDYTDFAVSSSDSRTMQDYFARGKAAYQAAGEDFQKVHDAVDEHYKEVKQEATQHE